MEALKPRNHARKVTTELLHAVVGCSQNNSRGRQPQSRAALLLCAPLMVQVEMTDQAQCRTCEVQDILQALGRKNPNGFLTVLPFSTVLLCEGTWREHRLHCTWRTGMQTLGCGVSEGGWGHR